MELVVIMRSHQINEEFISAPKLKGVINATMIDSDPDIDSYNAMKAAAIKSNPQILQKIEDENKRHQFECFKILNIKDSELMRSSMRTEFLRNKKTLFEINRSIYGLIISNKVSGVKVVEHSENNNLLTKGFYEELYAVMAGSLTAPSVDQTMYIEHIAVGTMSGDTDFDDEALGNEIFRDVPVSIQHDGVRTLYAVAYVGPSEANPDFTQVDSSTQTVITVDDATGFHIGAKLRVETTNNTYICSVTNVSGVNITVGSITGGVLTNAGEFLVSDVPQNGDYVYILISEMGTFVGGGSTLTPDTGNMIDRSSGLVHKKYPLSGLINFILSGDSTQ